MQTRFTLSVLLIIVLFVLTGQSSAQPQDQPTKIATRVSPELLAVQASQSPWTRRSPAPDVSPLVQIADDHVVIDAVAADDVQQLRADLEALGMQQPAVFGRTVSGLFPLSAIADMLDLDSLQFAQPSYMLASVGQTESQGVQTMRADVARSTFGIDGTGITVGTLSDSFDCLGGAAADVDSGDLPAGIQVIKEKDSCSTGTDEGRAMMQLIADVAPGTDQMFHTAFGGQATFAQGIVQLANAGADVIVDDVINLAEPMFQDGIIAQAVDTVHERGVAYFSAAGNNRRSAYEHSFVPGTTFALDAFPSAADAPPFFGGTAHDFGDNDVFQQITVPPGQGFSLVLQWDMPFFSVSGPPGASNDLDIYLLDDPPTRIIAGRNQDNILPNGSGDPLEIFSFTNPHNATSKKFNLMIIKYTGPNPGLLKYVRFDNGASIEVNEHDTASGSIYGHASAKGAQAVGAAFYYFTPMFGTDSIPLQYFSAAGPAPIRFTPDGTPTQELRKKPEIVAPDGGNTTFFGIDTPFDDDTFPNFSGTSAAAPHAAAVAALMLELNPNLSPQQINTALEQTALDMDSITKPGFDDDTGFGFIQADLATAAVQPGSITIRKATTPSGGTGFSFEGDLGAFQLNDGESQTSEALLAGTYNVRAMLPPGWQPADVTCDDDDSTTTTDGATIQLAAEEAVTCTFTSTQAPNAISVALATTPANGTDFTFDGDLGAFSLDSATLDDNDGISNTQTFADLLPGSYTLTQNAIDDWLLTEVACSPAAPAEVDLATRTVTLTLADGAAVSCTFVNERSEVAIDAFNASIESNQEVVLTWKTLHGPQDARFNVYRSVEPNDPGSKINDTPIASQADGRHYRFVDRPDTGTFYYHLEAEDTEAEQSLLGSVKVEVETAPTTPTQPPAPTQPTETPRPPDTGGIPTSQQIYLPLLGRGE